MTVLPPDINESDTDFTVVYTHPQRRQEAPARQRKARAQGSRSVRKIRFGLGAVRGLGERGARGGASRRGEGGPFRDLFDFASRVDAKRVNKGVFEALVQCGAFDSTLEARGVTRARAFASIDIALERSRAREPRSRGAGRRRSSACSTRRRQQARRRRRRAGDYVDVRAVGSPRDCSCARSRRSASTSPGTRSSATCKGERGRSRSSGRRRSRRCAAMDDWAQVTRRRAWSRATARGSSRTAAARSRSSISRTSPGA